LADIEKIQMEDSIIIQREDLLKVLLNVKFVSKIYPTEANFILIKVDDANRRYELIAKGIVIRIEQRNLCVKIAYD
jgi:histidinol-phosphate aminotransferase